MKKQREKKTKAIIFRAKEDLFSILQEEAKTRQMSLNSFIKFILNSYLKPENILFDETISKPERREVESRVFFTQSEVELLRKYAKLNEWGISREVRFRTISTLAKKPKLNTEELRAIYSVRSAINVLGANLNRLIRNDQALSDYNIGVCIELIELIKELRGKINYLEKCGNTHFKLISSSKIR
jgi:hypothetical protein